MTIFIEKLGSLSILCYAEMGVAMVGSGFLGRSLSTIADFSNDERRFLFEQSRILKEAFKSKEQRIIESFRINNPHFGIYEVFLENSTRTLESFRNAVLFHGVSLKVFDAEISSINKAESLFDTFNTLIGYNNHIFIVRSPHEGLCRWLEKSSQAYAERAHLAVPSFINAGDGQHEHPTQELLDEFSFLEQNNWSYEDIHLALVGDLLHGRTVHSKIDGLRIFANVCIDLVAPEDITLKSESITRMQEHGYKVRQFFSIEEYLQEAKIAPIWYFTRLQLERMGELLQRRASFLRESVSCSSELLAKTPSFCRFYHPFPRDKRFPVLPPAIDSTPFNRWEEQSRNGRIIRIVLLSMLGGKIGRDFIFPTLPLRSSAKKFYKKLLVKPQVTKRIAEGVQPLKNGLVIDHISRGSDPASIRKHIVRILRILDILNLQGRGGEWVSNSKKEKGVHKGIIFRPKVVSVSEDDLRKLASVAPDATLNVIIDSHVSEKYKLLKPQRIYGFSQLRCRNSACVSNPEYKECVEAEFVYNEKGQLFCLYCEHSCDFNEIWGD